MISKASEPLRMLFVLGEMKTQIAPSQAELLTENSLHLRIDRTHIFRGRDNIAWFFKARRSLRLDGDVIRKESLQFGYAVRELQAGECTLVFLFLVPKKFVRRANDRNKVRRWLKAAIEATPLFAQLEKELEQADAQMIVMIRGTHVPGPETNWNSTLSEIELLSKSLSQLLPRVAAKLQRALPPSPRSH